jgi:tyrosyl-tRNA synthetase
MDAWTTLEARGFVKQVTDLESLKQALSSGPVTFYAGFDPTADSLHIGHLLPVMAMAHLQRAGHVPIAVVGGGTAMVGDPSGKTELRQMLTVEDIAKNMAGMRAQLSRFLTVDGVSGHMIDNGEWLLGLNYIAFLRDIGRHFSVNRMLTMDSVKLRLEVGLSFIEFNYMLLQAYDFLELNRRLGCTLQLGGDDQWGNILAGTDLIRRVAEANGTHRGNAFGLTLPLITTATGAKMGKTAAGAVWLDPKRTPVFDFFQYWLNVDDRDVARFLKLYTFLPLDRIAALEALQGADIREAKRVLAREATTLVHGAEATETADAAALAMSRGEASADLPTVSLTDEDRTVVDALVRGGLAKSKGEGKRAIEGGGVTIDGVKVLQAQAPLVDVGAGVVLKVGKSRAVRVVRP